MYYDKTGDRVVLTVADICLCAGVLSPSPEPEPATRRAPDNVFDDVPDEFFALPRELRKAEVTETFGEKVAFCEKIEYRTECGVTPVTVTGRADAVCTCGRTVFAVEIRAVTEDDFVKPVSANSGHELMLNAAIIGLSRGLDSVGVRLIRYIPGDPDGAWDLKEKKVPLSALAGRFEIMLGQCVRRVRTEYEHGVNLTNLASLRFPFPAFREGQRELVTSVYSAALNKRRLFAQAPTGIGKTVSVLYGAVRAMAKGGFRRIFYLTAKASTRREAFAAAGKLNSAGAGLRTVVLAAKEQICPLRKLGADTFVCDPKNCPLMKNYAQGAGQALDGLLRDYHGYPVSAVTDAAAKAGVCPHELSLDLSLHCDVIICDYNYAFDPGVKLKRYFAVEGRPNGASVFLVDEAHNLTERARDIYSAEVTSDFAEKLVEVCGVSPDIRAAAENLRNKLTDAKDLCRDELYRDDEGREYGFYYSLNPVPELDGAVEKLHRELEFYCLTHKNDPEGLAAAYDALRPCRKWSDARENYDEKYRTYVSVNGGRISAKLFCLDPSGRLGDALEEADSAVFFSATLTPSDYFADVLGGGKPDEYRSVSLASPFPRENLCLCAVTSISTRYDDREKSGRMVAAVIAATICGNSGNYIVYFPSYSYMESVRKLFCEKYPNVTVKVQSRNMRREEKEEFLDFFEDDEGKLRVGFCVLGGSFSEGVDLPGRRLIGTVVVGVGLPGLSAERNMIRDYYENRIECGYDYAYTYPGMNSVMQAAGRVIRRDDDRGVVVLVDDRYATEQYRELMPPHWNGIRYFSDVRSLMGEITGFWNGKTE